MKTKIFTIILLFFYTSFTYSQWVGYDYALNTNNIYLPINYKGVLADVNVPPNGSGGQFGGSTFLFSGGFFLSGYSDGQLWANAVASATLVEDYLPGTYTNSTSAIYKLSSTDVPFNSSSWQAWQNAVSLGADFYDGDGNGYYSPIDHNGNGEWDTNEDRPDILGDETLWCVYHDGVPSIQRRWSTVEPQGIEIKQTVFAYSSVPELQNIVFIRYRITNTGLFTDEMTDVYFGIWDDPDIGDSQDDLFGCDTLLYGGYTYNDGADNIYGNNPPSFFATTLAGPVTYVPGETFMDNDGNGIYTPGIDTPLDTAFVNRGQILGVNEYPGAKNQRLSSMVHYINNDPSLNDPSNKQEARNYMNGLTKFGNQIHPCTWNYGQVLGGVNCAEVNPFYWYSGNPVTSYGWINTTPRDQRQLVNIGPFTLTSGDEYEIFIAYNVDQGTDALSSINEVKEVTGISQLLYECNFNPDCIVSVEGQNPEQFPKEYSLSQNYPNPFNPSTKISWQSPVGSWQTLKIYDVLGNEVVTLVDGHKSAGSYEIEWNATNYPSGVYFYQLKTSDFVQTRKMILLK